MSNEWFHHSSQVQYIRLSLRIPSNTVFTLPEPMWSVMQLKSWSGQESLYTLVSISSSFSTIPFFSIKKDVRLERLPLLYAVCSLLSCRVLESPTCRKRRCFRLLIVFSAGNLLVNQRGRVWGGENRKRLISHWPPTGRLFPWCQNAYRSLLFPVSGIIPVLW